MNFQSSDVDNTAAAAAATAVAVAVAAANGAHLDSSQHNPFPGVPMMASPGNAKSQKNIEKLICQVDDCHAPLEGLKDYHQRYRVCDVHLKIEWIEKDGIRLRFCQQCGRFQPLEDFDDMKRSCRARLQKHNARRRKRSRGGTAGDGTDTNLAGMYDPHGLAHHDPAAAAAIAAGFNPTEVAAMQQAMQFASATLMHTTAAAQSAGLSAGPNGIVNSTGINMIQPPNVDISAATASASIAGMPFGGTLQSMPFIPTKEVMTLLLKGYAGMFHYTIENVSLRPHAQPTSAEELAAPMEMAAAAAMEAAVMGAVGGQRGDAQVYNHANDAQGHVDMSTLPSMH
jgi:hypothetical protein